MHYLRTSICSSTIIFYTAPIKVIISSLTQTHSHMAICLHYNSLLSPILYNYTMKVRIFNYYTQSHSLPYIKMNTHPYLFHYRHRIIPISWCHRHKSTRTCLFEYQDDSPCHKMISSLSYMLINLINLICNLLHYTRISCLKILSYKSTFAQYAVLLKITSRALIAWVLTSLTYWITCYATALLFIC